GGNAMRCSSCGSESPDGKRFCADCGSALDNRCPECGSDNPVTKKFFGDCGAALFQTIAAPRSIERAVTHVAVEKAEQHEVPEGVRRQLTVMFCDLVNSTVLSERLDPEELREVIRIFSFETAKIIVRLGGYVAQYV